MRDACGGGPKPSLGSATTLPQRAETPGRSRDMRDVPDARPTVITVGHAQNLPVESAFVSHPQHAYGTRCDIDIRHDRRLQKEEGVERVAVFAEGVGDEPSRTRPTQHRFALVRQ